MNIRQLAEALLFSGISAAMAQNLTITADKEICKPGEPVRFEFKITDSKQRPVNDVQIFAQIRVNGQPTREKRFASGSPDATFSLTQTIPGTMLLVSGWPFKQANGKTITRWTSAGVVVGPDQIKAGLDEPSDFDQFWKDKKAELASVPMKTALVPVDLATVQNGKHKFYKDKGVEAFEIKIECAGGKPVTGYLARPVNASKKSLPAIVTFQHAGTYSASVPARFGTKAIAMDVNAHGILNGQTPDYYSDLAKKELKLYYYSGSDNRETYYYKGVYLRLIRALEYVKSLPEWNGKDLIVYGFSQGGAQALAAAGLEPQVSLCIAMCPALCDLGGIVAGRLPGWGTNVKFKDGKPATPKDEAILKATSYYDNANFAKRIKAETYISAGLRDSVVPTSSVYAAWNNLPDNIQKHFFLNRQGGHDPVASAEAKMRLNQIIFKP